MKRKLSRLIAHNLSLAKGYYIFEYKLITIIIIRNIENVYDDVWYFVIRATLLLVPLLGLHYLVIPFRPPKNHPWENFYEVLSAITASFQVGIFQLLYIAL